MPIDWTSIPIGVKRTPADVRGLPGTLSNKPYIEATVDCVRGGYEVKILVPTGTTASVSRRSTEHGGVMPVRGMQDIDGSVALRIIDYEAPIKDAVEYILYEKVKSSLWTALDPQFDYVELASITPPRFDEVCGVEQVLRLVFNPWEMTNDFCLGEIIEVDYETRSGVHTVIGRRDPVVVIDKNETARGVLRFISKNRQQLHTLRRLLTETAQPMLLQLDPSYELGVHGVLWFQPLAVRDMWLLPDARRPEHLFEVEFVEIAPPAATAIFEKHGVPFGLTNGGEWRGTTYPHGGWIQWPTAGTVLMDYTGDDTTPTGTGLQKQHGPNFINLRNGPGAAAPGPVDPTHPAGDPGSLPADPETWLTIREKASDDRWKSWESLLLSGKTFGEALFDVV